jgi:predicted glutamine amidotransferase
VPPTGSRCNPDGYGIGTFDDHDIPHVDKRPASAHDDEVFARARHARRSRARSSPTCATQRPVSGGPENTNPFLHGSLEFAHNGYIDDLESSSPGSATTSGIVKGDTDSERLFALIAKDLDAAGGDVETGLTAAVRWVAGNLPLFAINLVLASPGHVWALRYPESQST